MGEKRSALPLPIPAVNLVYHDDTNIDLEKQVAEMTKNHLLHNFALTVMTDQFQLLQTAISERV